MSDAVKTMLGWREWAALPELNIPRIKAKIDTGARTSALHAFKVEFVSREGVELVRFAVHPVQGNIEKVIWCESPLVENRWVSDSGGHREYRPVIRSTLCIGDQAQETDITLTDRDNMSFRLLIGRRALANYMIDPEASYLTGEQQGSTT